MRAVFADLAEKVSVVTGGSRGIGWSIARGLAAHDALVVLLASQPTVHEAAEKLAAEFERPILGVECDVSESDQVDATLRQVKEQLGEPSILINSAGVSVGAPAEDMTDDQWRRVLDINLTGSFFACRGFARCRESTAPPASIVNISSMSGRVVNVPQKQVAYNVSKAGVDMLTKTLAIEWADRGIRVNAIAPGYISTELLRDYASRNPEFESAWISRIPTGQMGTPDDLVDLALFLASSTSRYVVGETVVADGGYSLV
jgi:NAD(P)-dependent dehydrogenase (short-subunit alcohol dehydrogenase family)